MTAKTQRPELIPFYKISLSEYSGGESLPQQVMVTKFTNASVWVYCGTDRSGRVNTQLCRRKSDYDGYYPSLGDAIAACRGVLKLRIENLEDEIARKKQKLAEAVGADVRLQREQKSGKGQMLKWLDPDKRPVNIEV